MNPKKHNIVKAFMDLAIENPNLNEISVKMIADKAGIGKGTVYEYFSSKDEIIKDAVEIIIEQMYEFYLIDNFEGLSYEESLKQYIQNNYEAALKLSDFSRYNSFTIRETFKYVNMKDFLHSKIRSLLMKSIQMFKVNIVDRGISEGIIDENIDDLTITMLTKMILRDITENVEFKLIEDTTLNDALYTFAYKQLKRD